MQYGVALEQEHVMEFITVGELRTNSTKVWDQIAAGKEFVITRDGMPFALLVPTKPSEVENDLRALRGARFAAALKETHRHAVETGLDKMTLEEINAEIAAARKEIREREAGGH
jgi:antitoxin (DNA-binding transcriptional repressor) of toxin-antitoxin stability system